MKILRFIRDNILFFITLFLLVFIPLYPKIPTVGINNTWVYIRLEDFLVAAVVVIWAALLLKKKVTLKTPITLPILFFWIIGGIATLHGALLFFPNLANVFSNVAFLSYIRRIEYISLFFVAYTSIKDKRYLTYAIFSLLFILLAVVLYGFGQKYAGFPAYLTMNEQFAKGIPIRLSDLSRIPSTFAGQYDLAAYLVLVIPILVSVAFAFKNWLLKILFLGVAVLSFILMVMTVSRVSFVALVLSLVLLLLIQRRRLIIVSLLIIAVIFLIFSPSLAQRFNRTVSQVDVLVDSKTGAAIGQIREVQKAYFKDKIVLSAFIATPSSRLWASSSAIMPFDILPPTEDLLVPANAPTGETLPQGTGYVNLSLSPIIKKTGEYFFKLSKDNVKPVKIQMVEGDYLVKRAKAYDLSFTTRFQGEWPNTFNAFLRNIFLGSGYGSVSLAVDNDYLRMLGETGVLGIFAFISIFIFAAIYIEKTLSNVDSSLLRNFTLGFAVGTFGLFLNAIFIDVFEASKIAFSYWILLGIVLGTLHLYEREKIDFVGLFKKVIISPYAIAVYLLAGSFAFFSQSYGYFFVGDDFTWLRWASNCPLVGSSSCGSFWNTILGYFTQSNGFFYRPGTRFYFDVMYSSFWLNQTAYHFVSIFLHFLVVVLVFMLSRKVLKNYWLSVLSTFIFLILAVHHEDVFWMASVGFLFNAIFALSSLLAFIYWKEKKNKYYLISSIVFIILSLLFHELGVVVPFIIILYDLIFKEKPISESDKKIYSAIVFIPLIPYLTLRFLSNSHWFNGDYSYNLVKLPFNFVGNTIGYLALDLIGPQSNSFYQKARSIFGHHLLPACILIVILVIAFFFVAKEVLKHLNIEEKRIVGFAVMFFIVSLLPFLGLGNIADRYSYLSSMGIAILLVFFGKKFFGYFITVTDRKTTVLSMTIIVIVFLMIQLFQLQKLSMDWREAGMASNNLITAVEGVSRQYWIDKPSKLYFVNVPIKHGDAWVFPVGLKDAIYFAFENNDMQVYEMPSLDAALNAAGNNPHANVFRFDEEGNVHEYYRSRGVIYEKN